MRLASGKHARPYEMGLSFIKRETKPRLWAFALHDLVEQKIVIKYIKMFLSIFIAGLHTAIVCPIYLQRKYMVMQQIILIYQVFSQF